MQLSRVDTGNWLPVPGIDAATRADVDRRFLELVELRPLRDSEAGVVAVRPIAAGTTLIHLWHDEYYQGMVGWRALSVAEIDRLPTEQHALFRRYGLDMDFGRIWGPIAGEHVRTLDNFINHSCAPNLGYDEQGNVVPLRELSVGEELCLDYGGFAVNYDEPFECRCGAAACRRRITRQDWRSLATRALPPFVIRRFRA